MTDYTRPVPPLHHDGHGLNDRIHIASLGPEKGGSPDFYAVNGDGWTHHINFQHGPRGVEGSIDGLTHEALLAILIDRCEGFDRGPFSHPENSACLDHLRAALECCQRRANERAARNVLGQYKA